MLFRLGRWLRAAGYDVIIAQPGENDRELFKLARKEHRLLVTRDRKLAEYRDATSVVVILEKNDLKDCLQELSRLLSINWQKKPFSRCMVCNTPLVVASDAQYRALPDDVQEQADRAYYCPACKQLFWEGSHVRRMRQTLENFSHNRWEIAK
jgi:uncharacterized protein with PIN domain